MAIIVETGEFSNSSDLDRVVLERPYIMGLKKKCLHVDLNRQNYLDYMNLDLHIMCLTWSRHFAGVL